MNKRLRRRHIDNSGTALDRIQQGICSFLRERHYRPMRIGMSRVVLEAFMMRCEL